ncbi:MAG TPA: AraC family transcriptional regulator [Rhodocyclaceae bacterium]|nr:AraC family transcriptional regulator [Rhodocyclaceae bacterium]
MDKPINELSLDRLAELGRLIVKNSNGDGIHPVGIDSLKCIRMSAPNDELPHVYNPCVCVIVQGEKQVLLEGEIYRYAPQQFLAVSVDLPLLGQVLVASAEAPYLCLAIDLDASTIADLLAQTDDAGWSRGETARGVFVGDLDDATLESVVRLARLLDAPRDIPVLAPLALREFHYRLLRGPYGPAVAQMAIAGSNTHNMGQIIRRMRAHYAEPISVTELASQANMSPSSFHQHFKAVTAMSPLQYQKRLRLTEARGLLLGGGMDAASAAYRVGYQSVSQFSREYARLFGAPPIRDVEALRRA